MGKNIREFLAAALLTSLMSVLSSSAFAQIAGGDTGALPQDWSHRHLIYSGVETRDQATRKGVLAFEQWKKKNRDPRFAALAAKKAQLDRVGDDSPFSPRQLQWANRFKKDPPAAATQAHRDWSNVLGGASGVGMAGVFPAKFSFDINAAPSCANDFVVYTTASGGSTSAGNFPTLNGTFTARPTAGQTVTITRTGSPAITLTASTTQNLTLTFQIGANATVTRDNLASAIARNGGTAGVTATTSGTNTVVVSALTAGVTPSVTFAETLGNFSWAGSWTVPGGATAGQPTIVAFNQLYASCGTTPTQAVPSTFWSYNTGIGAFTETSPVLSLSGNQVAFVQRAGAVASLVLLKWSSTAPVGTVGAPTVPTSVTLANYRSCTAPCMTVVAFNGNPNNTNSAPFYDYGSDILYVGDSAGNLHKFTGVFAGTPAEAGSPWPVTASTGNMLSSPVYDSATGLVFVGSDTNNNLTGGQLHSVCATPPVPANAVCTAAGTVTSSGQLAAITIQADSRKTTGVRDGPIVDSTARRLYVFVESDTNNTCGGVNCKAVFQFRTDTPISGNQGSASGAGFGVARVNVGRGQIATRILYAGVFDNDYFDSTSGTETSPTGNLYVCGALVSGSDSKKPTLWRISITNNAMSASVVGPALVAVADPGGIDGLEADCSPLTTIMNGANEYVYAGVSALGNKTGCSGACIYMVRTVPNGGVLWSAATPIAAGLSAPGGTGGIVVDNISATQGASQVYYSTRTSPGNAVQASQAALQ